MKTRNFLVRFTTQQVLLHAIFIHTFTCINSTHNRRILITRKKYFAVCFVSRLGISFYVPIFFDNAKLTPHMIRFKIAANRSRNITVNEEESSH